MSGLVIGLAVLAAVCGKPRYDAFIQKENRETCEGARYIISAWYYAALQEEAEAGVTAERLDYDAILREVITVHFPSADPSDDLSLEHFCRAGGHIQFVIDAQTHELSSFCSIAEHADYEKGDLTDQMLDEFDSLSSGIDLEKKSDPEEES